MTTDDAHEVKMTEYDYRVIVAFEGMRTGHTFRSHPTTRLSMLVANGYLAVREVYEGPWLAAAVGEAATSLIDTGGAAPVELPEQPKRRRRHREITE